MSLSTPSRRTTLVLTLAAASWGIGTVVSKRATTEIPPVTLLVIQLATSLVVLALFMRWRRMPFRDPALPPVLGRLGVLNPGLAYALGLLGLTHITASLSVLLWATEPVLILFLSSWMLRERITSRLVVLSLVALAGMVLVVQQPGSSGSLLGVGLTMAGVGCCAIYTVTTRRLLGQTDETSQVLAAQQAYALAFAAVVVSAIWVAGGTPLPTDVSVAGWASAITSGVLYYAVAYWLYLSGLREVPASVAATSFYLIPVFGVGAGVLLLGERLAPGQWLGAAIALIAIYLILRRTSSHEVDAVEIPIPARG